MFTFTPTIQDRCSFCNEMDLLMDVPGSEDCACKDCCYKLERSGYLNWTNLDEIMTTMRESVA